jgi:hypothetical protein
MQETNEVMSLPPYWFRYLGSLPLIETNACFRFSRIRISLFQTVSLFHEFGIRDLFVKAECNERESVLSN